MGAVNQLLAKHGVQVRRGRVDVHRDQGIVERFNRTLAERLFGHQYAQEMSFRQRGSSKQSTEWVARLPAVVAALNNEMTRLINKKPADAISAAIRCRKGPLLSFLAAPLVLRNKRSPLAWAFAISISPGSWRVAAVARPTPCGPSGCAGLGARPPSPVSLSCIIFKMGQPVGSSEKSCSWCHLTPSCLPRGLSPGDKLGDIVIHSGHGIFVAIG